MLSVAVHTVCPTQEEQMGKLGKAVENSLLSGFPSSHCLFSILPHIFRVSMHSSQCDNC